MTVFCIKSQKVRNYQLFARMHPFYLDKMSQLTLNIFRICISWELWSLVSFKIAEFPLKWQASSCLLNYVVILFLGLMLVLLFRKDLHPQRANKDCLSFSPEHWGEGEKCLVALQKCQIVGFFARFVQSDFFTELWSWVIPLITSIWMHDCSTIVGVLAGWDRIILIFYKLTFICQVTY